MRDFAQTIVAHLALAANSAIPLAIGWHVATAIAAVALLGGFRPTNRQAGLVSAALIASAAAAAAAFGNPFNAAVLGALSLVLFALAFRLDSRSARRSSARATTAAVLLIAFGVTYPHFLATDSVLAYVYAAPLGVVPCPTLSLVVGVALAASGLQSRAWSWTVAGVGLFYGLVGALFLNVWLDVVLVAGSATLALVARADLPRESAAPADPSVDSGAAR